MIDQKQYQKEWRIKHKSYYRKRSRCLGVKLRRKVNMKNRNNIKRVARNSISLINKTCEICGSTTNLQRHHWRYDKPLFVSILCKTCHKIQHYKSISPNYLSACQKYYYRGYRIGRNHLIRLLKINCPEVLLNKKIKDYFRKYH